MLALVEQRVWRRPASVPWMAAWNVQLRRSVAGSAFIAATPLRSESSCGWAERQDVPPDS